MFTTVRRSLSAIAMTSMAALAISITAAQQRTPTFTVDPTWPSIPNNWVLGEVTSIATDSRDHIWVLHRPRSIPAEKRAQAAPPVLEFDNSGTLLASWGGDAPGYDWPEREHGIFVDAKDFVWISGNGGWPRPTTPGTGDDMILKFTMAGKLVMQIGHRGQSKGNADTENVHQPADTFVDARASELYVADGYGDQRIVVFDTNTGKFKRMWGAFGNTPAPEMKPNPPVPQPQEPGSEGPQQFGLPHAVKVSNDGTVYVADRIILPMLSPTQLEAVAAGTFSIDERVRSYVAEHLGFRWLEMPDAESTRALEAMLRRGEWKHGRPFLNPAPIRPSSAMSDGVS